MVEDDNGNHARSAAAAAPADGDTTYDAWAAVGDPGVDDNVSAGVQQQQQQQQ